MPPFPRLLLFRRLPVAASCEFPRPVIPMLDKTVSAASDSGRRPGIDVVTETRGGARWEVRADWRQFLFGDEAPDWLFLESDPRATAIKAGHARTTWRVDLDGRAVFAKAIESSGLISRLRRSAFGDPARREWRASLAATARGVRVAPGVAFGVGPGPLGTRCVFLSEGLREMTSLAEVWQSQVPGDHGGARPVASEGIIEAVARLFATAHAHGFAHGDAHPRNILISAAPCGACDAVFVDVHAARLSPGRVPLPDSMRSLAELDQYFHRKATRSQRLRFFRRYVAIRAAPGQPEPVDVRTLLASLQVERRSRALALARHRDRRLRRHGKYFATLDLSGGWRATVTLALTRRHVFPERDLPDRTESDWRRTFEGLLTTVGDVCVSHIMFDRDGLQVEIVRLGWGLRRWAAVFLGSPHRRSFTRSHRLRHRDVPAEFMLACAEHYSGGVIDATVLIRPARRHGE